MWRPDPILKTIGEVQTINQKLREENARLRAEVKRVNDALDQVRDLANEIARLEGLILAHEHAYEHEMPNIACQTEDALLSEARRIRAARSGSEERGQPMLHAFDCPCVMCDPMQVREEQQRRSEPEDPQCQGDG